MVTTKSLFFLAMAIMMNLNASNPSRSSPTSAQQLSIETSRSIGGDNHLFYLFNHNNMPEEQVLTGAAGAGCEDVTSDGTWAKDKAPIIINVWSLTRATGRLRLVQREELKKLRARSSSLGLTPRQIVEVELSIAGEPATIIEQNEVVEENDEEGDYAFKEDVNANPESGAISQPSDPTYLNILKTTKAELGEALKNKKLSLQSKLNGRTVEALLASTRSSTSPALSLMQRCIATLEDKHKDMDMDDEQGGGGGGPAWKWKIHKKPPEEAGGWGAGGSGGGGSDETEETQPWRGPGWGWQQLKNPGNGDEESSETPGWEEEDCDRKCLKKHKKAEKKKRRKEKRRRKKEKKRKKKAAKKRRKAHKKALKKGWVEEPEGWSEQVHFTQLPPPPPAPPGWGGGQPQPQPPAWGPGNPGNTALAATITNLIAQLLPGMGFTALLVLPFIFVAGMFWVTSNRNGGHAAAPYYDYAYKRSGTADDFDFDPHQRIGIESYDEPTRWPDYR